MSIIDAQFLGQKLWKKIGHNCLENAQPEITRLANDMVNSEEAQEDPELAVDLLNGQIFELAFYIGVQAAVGDLQVLLKRHRILIYN